jgi:hypothetical protein
MGRDFSRATRAEFAAVLVLALLCADALLAPHVTSGGRYLDDWWLGAYVSFPHELGFDGARDYLGFYSGARPGAVLYWLGTYDLFGFRDVLHRTLSVDLAGGLATVFYLLLRELRLGRVDAAAIALLTLALPVADSIHFWITPAVGQLGLGACVAGLLVGLRALRAEGRRSLALHGVSLALFAASLSIAETAIPLVALSLLVYRVRVGWRRAAGRWAADLVVAGVGALHYAANSPVRLRDDSASVGLVERARTIADQLVTLATGTLAPFAPSRAWVLGAIAVVGGLLALRWSVRRDWTQERRWLAAAGLAALLAGASYVIYVPADPSYLPLAAGVGNRVNLGALLPLSVLAYALVRLAGGLVAAPRPRAVVTVALFAVLFVSAAGRLHADRRLWEHAAGEQRFALAAVHEALPAPPGGSSLLVFGVPGVVTRFGRIGHARVNQPVPVFSTWWELDVAVKLSYGRSDIAAYPIWADQPPQLICGAYDVYQLGLDGVRHALAYGRVYAVDTAEPRAIRLDGQAQCERVTDDALTIRYDLPV